MSKTINWASFYNMLCRQGPDLLLGIDEDLRAVIKETSLTTDMFWSEELQVLLEEKAASGELKEGVMLVLEQWRENVLASLAADFGFEQNSKSVGLDKGSPLIEELLATASSG